MNEYQAQIVGFEKVPTKYQKGRWEFLDAYAERLNGGQALRLVLPKGASPKGAICHWRKVVGYRAKAKEVKQPNGSIILWLWIKEGNHANHC